jgi:hypothetical protein
VHHQYNDDFQCFRNLAQSVFSALIGEGYARCELSSEEYLFFGLRYGLIDGDFNAIEQQAFTGELRSAQQIAFLAEYYGYSVPIDEIASSISGAEGKVAIFIWELINDSVNLNLELT